MEGGGDRTPEVGVLVLIIRGSSVLFGRRRTATGKDTFAPPGGHLEFGESFEACAAREVKEETGLGINNIEVMKIINNVNLDGPPHPSHFVIVLVRAVLSDPVQEPVNVEPDKCDGWAWYEWGHLPDPLFPPFQTLVRSGFNPFISPPHQLVINA